MKEVITIANRKGGVAKTATAHALGAGLTHRGYKVLFIDLDSQCSLTYCLGAKREPITSMEVLTGQATAEEAIQHTEGGDIIPASTSLDLASENITGKGKEYRLKEAIQPLKKKYDYIIIDTPPALGILIINALTASNSVIIPAQTNEPSANGVALFYEAVQVVRKYTNPDLRIKGILLTICRTDTILYRDYRKNIEAIAKAIGTKVFNTPIREYVAFSEAQTSQKDIYTYAPKSNATADYTAFVEEVLSGAK